MASESHLSASGVSFPESVFWLAECCILQWSVALPPEGSSGISSGSGREIVGIVGSSKWPETILQNKVNPTCKLYGLYCLK